MHGLVFPVLALAVLARSSPLAPAKSCQEYTLPLNVTSTNLQWALDPLESNEDIAEFNTQEGRRDVESVFHPVTVPAQPETKMYTISGTFCRPSNGGSGTVLVATHGGGYDRAYWHPSIQPENYSFVDHAVGKGYSVFYYDRIGLGKSEPVSGYIPQASLNAAVIAEIVKLVRSGKFGTPADTKVALIGHSLGSAYSNVMLHNNPELVDAAVLTGGAYNITNTPVANQANQWRLANSQNSTKWGGLDGGWITWVDVYSNIESFFKTPFYDRAVVQWAEDNKQPLGVLENLSLGSANFSSPSFTGPIMIMSGEYDFVACGGYCPGTLDDLTTKVFPASKKLVTYVQPGSGHAINFSLNATGAFEVITNFLQEGGL